MLYKYLSEVQNICFPASDRFICIFGCHHHYSVGSYAGESQDKSDWCRLEWMGNDSGGEGVGVMVPEKRTENATENERSLNSCWSSGVW